MRAVIVLLVGCQILLSAPRARAETQVKADDCSSAVNGTMIGSHIEIHCLSQEDIKRVLDELVRQGVVKRAGDVGIETSVIVSLAARLKPTQKLDFAQAVVEVSHVVDIAMTVATQGSGSTSDQLINEVLKRVAEKTRANDPVGATREAEDGFARWEKQEAERRTSASAEGVTLLQAALKTDLLRFDAGAVARRVEKIGSLEHENDPKALFNSVGVEQAQFVREGEDKGVNFSLEVAIAIGRRLVELARDPDQRGEALTNLGVALEDLGERQGQVGMLEEAAKTYRLALEERTRERVPFNWAITQINLGDALLALGERQSDTTRLEEAVAAFHAALGEVTHDRAPFEWAGTQLDVGNALMRLGERETGTEKLDEAVQAYHAALEEWTRTSAPKSGQKFRTVLASCSRYSANGSRTPASLRRLFRRIRRRFRSERASALPSSGRKRR
jgi:tetratricopeptide (TPR) repeat protein/competence protein ComGC